jgi:hypothetical protein
LQNALTSGPPGEREVAPPPGLAHGDQPIADIDGVDAKGRPAVAQPRAGNQLAESCDSPLKRIARQSRQWMHQRRRSHIGNRPHRSGYVGIGLKVLIDHYVTGYR